MSDWLGQRVAVIEKFTDQDAVFIRQRVGTIVDYMLYENEPLYLIDMVAPVRQHGHPSRAPIIGHNGNGFGKVNATEGHGWWLSAYKVQRYLKPRPYKLSK